MRAIISGAGIAGLSNARFLADAGWDVVLVERAPARRQEGYMMDFLVPVMTPRRSWACSPGCGNWPIPSMRWSIGTAPAVPAQG